MVLELNARVNPRTEAKIAATREKVAIVHFRDLVSFICCTIGRIERMDPLR